jgi:hypothetical protein
MSWDFHSAGASSQALLAVSHRVLEQSSSLFDADKDAVVLFTRCRRWTRPVVSVLTEPDWNRLISCCNSQHAAAVRECWRDDIEWGQTVSEGRDLYFLKLYLNVLDIIYSVSLYFNLSSNLLTWIILFLFPCFHPFNLLSCPSTLCLTFPSFSYSFILPFFSLSSILPSCSPFILSSFAFNSTHGFRWSSKLFAR